MTKKTEKEKKMIEAILYWAKVIADAGYGHIKWVCPQVERNEELTKKGEQQ